MSGEAAGICQVELDRFDRRLRELGSAAALAAQAAGQLGDDQYADMFGHVKGCADSLRAELDDLRGMLLREAMREVS